MSKSIAQVLDLKDDPKIIAEYEEYHRNVWPEVLEALKGIGIERMEIFRSGNSRATLPQSGLESGTI